MVKVGFIGFGEVGRAFCQRMKDQGAQIVVYDKYLDRIIRKAEEGLVKTSI